VAVVQAAASESVWVGVSLPFKFRVIGETTISPTVVARVAITSFFLFKSRVVGDTTFSGTSGVGSGGDWDQFPARKVYALAPFFIVVVDVVAFGWVGTFAQLDIGGVSANWDATRQCEVL
jgi:hypothetical protein